MLKDDLNVLKSARRRSAKDLRIIAKSCGEVREHRDYDPQKSIHFSLLPQPFIGDVLNAEIYILTLNPGFGCGDYEANYREPGFREVLLGNMRQQKPSGVLPFFFLDPKFDWHGGYHYWFSQLAQTICEIAQCRKLTPNLPWKERFEDARNMLGRKLAVVELVPYHSATSGGLGNLPDKLHSTRLAIKFVNEHVAPKVINGDAIVISVRQVKWWDQALGTNPQLQNGIIRYDRLGEARGARLDPNSRGGQAIIDWFCSKKT